VRFWDSSALIPLIVTEPASSTLVIEYERDPELIVWWATEVECESALARRERDGPLPIATQAQARHRLAELARSWQEVQPIPRVRETARRLVRVHPLRAGDALQLAAAIVAARDDLGSLPFVTLDERLARAAEREGFPVLETGANA
jgi:predicted nucleic acid-binding protein